MEKRANNPPHRQKAFSLMEVVLVVAIVALLAAVAMPRYTNSLNSYRATLAAKRIAADLNLARQVAWTTGASQSATFTVSQNQYQLAGQHGLDRSTASYVVNLSSNPYSATLQSVSLGGPTTVTFNAWGFPDCGGQIVVQSGGFRRTVVLDSATGNATVQ